MLREQGHDVTAFHAGDYLTGKNSAIEKLSLGLQVDKNYYQHALGADIVEAAGGIGWKLFQRLKELPAEKRPICVARIHGLEFLDEQTRINGEIAQQFKLPHKYRWFSRHWVNWQEFAAIRSSDAALFYTSRDADALIAAHLQVPEKTFYVPGGVDESYIRSRTDYGSGNRLLWWGSWSERKGIATFPRAFDLARQANPALRLSIGGSGQKAEQILPLFAPESRPHIAVLPFLSREEHLQTLLSHDIFMFPSLSEGFGLALLEAMATGMACISTFTGLGNDYLEHNTNSLVVPMSAPTPQAREIVRLSGDAALRERIGRNAHETARPLTWDNFGKKTEAVYQHLLESKQ